MKLINLDEEKDDPLEDITIPTDVAGLGGDITLIPGRNADGTQAPGITIKADGTFCIGDREVDTDEEVIDAFVDFSKNLQALFRI